VEAVARRSAAIVVAALAITAAMGYAELNDRLSPPLDHPAIEYFNYLKHPPRDVVSDLKRKIEAGTVQLKFDSEKGYLPAVLDALKVPVESQMAVFSKTSFQEARIEPGNPRTIFFNDQVSVAWMHGGFIELAAEDPEQGVSFYSIEQQFAPQPNIVRRDDCLRCHRSDVSLGVPGMILRSFYTLPDGRPKLILGAYTTDHRSPFEERWGGWYVSGTMEHGRHMGNAMLADPDKPESMVRREAPLASRSDIVALLVFNHQMHMTNLITRVGWEVRCALSDKTPPRAFDALLQESAKELVDYLFFIDERPLPGTVHGTSGFAEKFAAQGPRDSQGRSLRQLDLRTRLLRYPCSYMIYSPAFDSLPEQARNAVYRRMWQILSGAEQGSRYARLSLSDRRAIVDILRATKPGLPGYFLP
jgi:hypothetical protein